MQTLTPHYDTVVIGRGLSLIVASLASVRSGARTLMIPFDDETLVNSQPAHVDGVDLHNLLRELGFSPAELRKLEPLRPSLQFVSDRRRFDLFGDHDRLRREYEREFPEARAAGTVDEWLNEAHTSLEHAQRNLLQLRHTPHLPPRNVVEQQRCRRYLKQQAQPRNETVASLHDWQPHLKAVAAQLLNAKIEGDLSCRQTDILYALSHWGGYQSGSLYNELLQIFAKRGGAMLKANSLVAIHTKRRVVTQIETNDPSFALVRAKSVIFADYPHHASPYFADHRTEKKWSAWTNQLPILYDRLTIPLRILSEGVPIGLAKRSILLPSDETHDPSETLFLERTDSDESTTTMWVRFLIPHHNEIPYEWLQKEGLPHLMRKLEGVIPFLSENLVPPFQPPRLHGYVYGLPDKSYLECSGLSTETPLLNLFHLSPAHLPLLGSEGVILSALRLFQRMSERNARQSFSLVR